MFKRFLTRDYIITGILSSFVLVFTLIFSVYALINKTSTAPKKTEAAMTASTSAQTKIENDLDIDTLDKVIANTTSQLTEFTTSFDDQSLSTNVLGTETSNDSRGRDDNRPTNNPTTAPTSHETQRPTTATSTIRPDDNRGSNSGQNSPSASTPKPQDGNRDSKPSNVPTIRPSSTNTPEVRKEKMNELENKLEDRSNIASEANDDKTEIKILTTDDQKTILTKETERRLSKLDNIISKINNSTNLTDDQKKALIDQLNTEKVKIKSSKDDLNKSDVNLDNVSKDLNDDHKSFVNILPKTNAYIALDRMTEGSNRFEIAINKLDDSISTLALNGKDTLSISAKLNELKNNKSKIDTDIAALKSLLDGTDWTSIQKDSTQAKAIKTKISGIIEEIHSAFDSMKVIISEIAALS